MHLTRFLIKKVTSSQLKEVADNCGRASLIVSPSENNLWDVSVCLKASELDRFKQMGYRLDRQAG